MNNQLSKAIVKQLIKISAIKLQPDSPFVWRNGWTAPIYTDNLIALSLPDVRNFVKIELARVILEQYPAVQVIASVSTRSIALGAIVADVLGLPFIYVRSTPKDHGLENLIEGNLKAGENVVLLEDILSTGANYLRAAQTVMLAGGNVMGGVALFSYEFEQAREAIEAEQVKLVTITGFNAMLEVATELHCLDQDTVAALTDWHADPANWTPTAIEPD